MKTSILHFKLIKAKEEPIMLGEGAPNQIRSCQVAMITRPRHDFYQLLVGHFVPTFKSWTRRSSPDIFSRRAQSGVDLQQPANIAVLNSNVSRLLRRPRIQNAVAIK